MRLTSTPRGTRRGGFTLVELLVAAALTVLVMAVLATAFSTGMQTLSHLKSVVGLSEQLRSAEAVILRDLQARHLEADTGEPVRVSDARLATNAWTGLGFFNVVPAVGTKENTLSDPDGLDSYRVTDARLAFTSKLAGNSAQEVYVGAGPNPLPLALANQSLRDFAPGSAADQFVGQWAEVAYFLAPTGVKTIDVFDDTGVIVAQAVPLHSLCREQRVLAPSSVQVPNGTTVPATFVAQYPELSLVVSGSQVFINSPLTVGTAANRAQPVPISDPSKVGTDVLLSNVISMQVRVLTNVNGQQFMDQIPGGLASLDTATAPGAGTAKPVLRAVQIRLRIYDVKNRMTRQMTIVQDL